MKFRSNVGEPRRRRGGRNRPSQGTLFSPASAEAPPLFSSGINGPTRSVLLRFEKSLALKKKHSKQYSVRIRRHVTYFRSLQKDRPCAAVMRSSRNCELICQPDSTLSLGLFRFSFQHVAPGKKGQKRFNTTEAQRCTEARLATRRESPLRSLCAALPARSKLPGNLRAEAAGRHARAQGEGARAVG